MYYVCTNNRLPCEVPNFRFPVRQYLQALVAVNVGWLEQLALKASVTLNLKIPLALLTFRVRKESIKPNTWLNPSNFIPINSNDSGGKSFLLHFASFRNVHSAKISDKTIFLDSS